MDDRVRESSQFDARGRNRVALSHIAADPSNEHGWTADDQFRRYRYGTVTAVTKLSINDLGGPVISTAGVGEE